MHVLGVRCKRKRSLKSPGIERLARHLSQSPRRHREPHQRPQIRPATRAHAGATKARLTDRAMVHHLNRLQAPGSTLSLDEEQQLLERLRRLPQHAGVARRDRDLDLFGEVDRLLAIFLVHATK